MKIVVIGGTGLIGSKVVQKLNHHDYEVVAPDPTTGVDTVPGAVPGGVCWSASIAN